MYRDGGKFRPKHSMPGITPCVIHTEKPGDSPEERKAKVKRSAAHTISYDYGIFANRQSQRTATLGGLAKCYESEIPQGQQLKTLGTSRLNLHRAMLKY
jgi:hypothetical protein